MYVLAIGTNKVGVDVHRSVFEPANTDRNTPIHTQGEAERETGKTGREKEMEVDTEADEIKVACTYAHFSHVFQTPIDMRFPFSTTGTHSQKIPNVIYLPGTDPWKDVLPQPATWYMRTLMTIVSTDAWQACKSQEARDGVRRQRLESAVVKVKDVMTLT